MSGTYIPGAFHKVQARGLGHLPECQYVNGSFFSRCARQFDPPWFSGVQKFRGARADIKLVGLGCRVIGPHRRQISEQSSVEAFSHQSVQRDAAFINEFKVAEKATSTKHILRGLRP
jgi:hypothetical protein